jgi:hypothetical protein
MVMGRDGQVSAGAADTVASSRIEVTTIFMFRLTAP